MIELEIIRILNKMYDDTRTIKLNYKNICIKN